MMYNPDYIAKLTLDEIAGTITPDDKEYLDHVIAESEEAHEIWQQIHNRFAAPHVQQELDVLQERLSAEEVIMMSAKRSSKTKYIKMAASVAAVAIIFLGIQMFNQPDNMQDGREEAAVTREKKHIELQLAGGETVDLSNATGQLQIGNVSINNNNKTLAYSTLSTATSQWAMLHVPAGKDYKIELTDGTKVWMNAATSLQFPLSFTGNTREITINGEAYLEVAKNADKPFIVHLPNSTVQVLGTAFNVNTYDSGQVKVALVEGSVTIKAGDDSILLNPGYAIDFTRQRGMKMELFDANDVLSWRQGIHLFNAASAQEVCLIMQRHYGVDVVMDDEISGHRSFTGSLDRNKPITSFLEVLKFSKYINDYYFSTDSVLYIR